MVSNAQLLKPYVKAFSSNATMIEIEQSITENLKANGIDLLGKYSPADEAVRMVMVVSSSDLMDAIKSVGGQTGFAAALRIAITKEGDRNVVSFSDPYYWGNAYFMDGFPKVKNQYDAFNTKIVAALKACGTWDGSPFGSKKGIEADDLREYHYMFGMPRFDDHQELNEFESYEAAVKAVEANLAKGVANVSKVYSIEIPGKKLKLYGIALGGEKGESKFLPTIDRGTPKHTAFLPYEMLIMDNKVLMLHGRYRIAVAFPDLTMGTFTKIMSAPGNIEKLMKSVCQ